MLEEAVSIYSVKLVDHRSSTPAEMSAITASISRIMVLAFVGTSDSISVSWGAGRDTDNFVIHFVEDIGGSYLRDTWPNMDVNPKAGGHTHASGSLAGSELYRSTPSGPI